MGETLRAYCTRTQNTGLLDQWVSGENGNLTPDNVSYGSRKPVWWQCEQGHRWQAMIYTRTEGSECPYCTGVKVLAGFNDLATIRPEIAAQWHPDLNGALTPQTVTAGSKKQAWWQCGEGHVWKAYIFSRTGATKRGCPICAGRLRQAKTLPYPPSMASVFSTPEK